MRAAGASGGATGRGWSGGCRPGGTSGGPRRPPPRRGGEVPGAGADRRGRGARWGGGGDFGDLEKMRIFGSERDALRAEAQLERSDGYWQVGENVSAMMDVGAMVAFAYQGFVLHEDDTVIDPLAWRLGFGAIVVFLAFKLMQVYMGLLQWFHIWVGLMLALDVGHVYGAVRSFLWLYNQVFPCFQGIGGSEFNMCYRGQILVGHTMAMLYLTGSVFFLWAWRDHKIDSLKKRGLYTAQLNMDELLSNVDEKVDKYHRVYDVAPDHEGDEAPLMPDALLLGSGGVGPALQGASGRSSSLSLRSGRGGAGDTDSEGGAKGGASALSPFKGYRFSTSTKVGKVVPT